MQYAKGHTEYFCSHETRSESDGANMGMFMRYISKKVITDLV